MTADRDNFRAAHSARMERARGRSDLHRAELQVLTAQRELADRADGDLHFHQLLAERSQQWSRYAAGRLDVNRALGVVYRDLGNDLVAASCDAVVAAAEHCLHHDDALPDLVAAEAGLAQARGENMGEAATFVDWTWALLELEVRGEGEARAQASKLEATRRAELQQCFGRRDGAARRARLRRLVPYPVSDLDALVAAPRELSGAPETSTVIDVSAHSAYRDPRLGYAQWLQTVPPDRAHTRQALVAICALADAPLDEFLLRLVVDHLEMRCLVASQHDSIDHAMMVARATGQHWWRQRLAARADAMATCTTPTELEIVLAWADECDLVEGYWDHLLCAAGLAPLSAHARYQRLPSPQHLDEVHRTQHLGARLIGDPRQVVAVPALTAVLAACHAHVMDPDRPAPGGALGAVGFTGLDDLRQAEVVAAMLRASDDHGQVDPTRLEQELKCPRFSSVEDWLAQTFALLPPELAAAPPLQRWGHPLMLDDLLRGASPAPRPRLHMLQ
jgi:hypothetical protein